jgi:hypothetical protein
MARRPTVRPLVLAAAMVLAAGAAPGCTCDGDNIRLGARRDLAQAAVDLAVAGPAHDLAGANYDLLTACGDFDPSCTVVSLGPSSTVAGSMFPLPSDRPAPESVTANGIGRNPTGWLVLDSTHATFDYLWVADDTDYGIGLVSKVSTKARTAPAGAINGKYAEVARYLTVTCNSDSNPANWPTAAERSAIKLGTTTMGVCTGSTTGCCDNAAPGRRTPVQLIRNRPSRTAVDFDGNMWVANRAHEFLWDATSTPSQSSVTKIANGNDSNPAMSGCRDRNGNGVIDTSRDENGDGIINTDCDADNVPDDLSTTCLPGVKKEFYGLDDECVLFTLNTGAQKGAGRPLTLGSNVAGDLGPSDAWAGRYVDGIFYRISGVTGQVVTQVQLKDPAGKIVPHPYGAAIDRDGILWAPNIDDHSLFYFDTKSPTLEGVVTADSVKPSVGDWGTGFYGIGIDGFTVGPDGGALLTQQIWLGNWQGQSVYRYRPMRTGAFADLGKGTWARVDFQGYSNSVRGVAVDNRAPTAFAWAGLDSTPGALGRVPTDAPDGVSTSSAIYPNDGVASLGVGVAVDLQLWTINNGSSTLSRYTVDGAGTVAVDTMGKPITDRVTLDDNPRLAPEKKPNPYTYSDFTGFGLRNFTNPRGAYAFRQAGCGGGAAKKTHWLKIVWDADVPPGTTLAVKARSADDATSLPMATFTPPYDTSPADLSQPVPGLVPNPSGLIEVEFDFTTSRQDTSPTLKGFQILYECVNDIN